MRMSPALGSSNPAMQRRMVVLPHPLDPSSTEIAPARNETVKSEITSTLPNDLARCSIATLAATPSAPRADRGSVPGMMMSGIGKERQEETARQRPDVRE